ncbi:helix-turn-helix domain-containing protein [Anabaena azotica]|uniref:helix-turn-helix domain-containing protein n=1 Tax=Anabaena azotica TaxID=197653 RepID=UPI0039A46D2D
MINNPHLGGDVLAFLDSIIPDTPETRLVERQEIFRIALTQAMRDVRKRVGLTQKELSQKLDVGQSWISKLESANNDHTFESVLAYLNALGVDFEATIILKNQKIKVVAAKLGANQEEIDAAIEPIWDNINELEHTEKNTSTEFALITPEQKSKCNEAQQAIVSCGLWGIAA